MTILKSLTTPQLTLLLAIGQQTTPYSEHKTQLFHILPRQRPTLNVLISLKLVEHVREEVTLNTINLTHQASKGVRITVKGFMLTEQHRKASPQE